MIWQYDNTSIFNNDRYSKDAAIFAKQPFCMNGLKWYIINIMHYTYASCITEILCNIHMLHALHKYYALFFVKIVFELLM